MPENTTNEVAEQAHFEGLKVADLEFELGGGGTARETEIRVNLGDTVEGTWRGKVVNVKHPLKSGQVVRMQTINIESAELEDVVERYEPPAEQPTLDDAGDD